MTSQNVAHYFPNASNSIINNPKITHVSGNAYFGGSGSHGMRMLLNNISTGAFHDAAERGDPPRCHPYTRRSIRAEIMEWIKAPKAIRKLIIWMYGPAGSGKTAIVQSIAEECQTRGLLAASFFFGRTAAGRNDTTRVVATLSYQLARSIPEIRELIIAAIEDDPTIFSRALATQMQVLVVTPLKSVPPSLKPIFIILDGVDESGPNAQSQIDLLNSVGMAVSELQHIPLTFLIASRPEYEIREAFNDNPLNSFVQPLVLDDINRAAADIKLYLQSKFEEIHAKNLRVGTHLPPPWPSTRNVDYLVGKASGQFIFAATIVKFIDSARNHPQQRLDIILGLSAPGHETPFALLDALYRLILCSAANLPWVMEIMMLLILHRNYDMPTLSLHCAPPIKLRVKFVEELLCIEVHRALVDMHALVFVPPFDDDESVLRIHHSSLCDFLMDQSRSKDLYIDSRKGHVALSRRYLKLATSYRVSGQLSLRNMLSAFIYHFNQSPRNNDIANDLACFSLTQLLQQMDNLGDLYAVDWGAFLECSQRHAIDRVDIVSRLQSELSAFIFDRLSKYPPALRTCIPAIYTFLWDRDVLFNLLLCSPSAGEIGENLALDSRLLYLSTTGFRLSGLDYFYSLFQDSARAGQYYADGESFVLLAKHVVKSICSKDRPGEESHHIKFESDDMHSEDNPKTTRHINLYYDADCSWFAQILSKASINLDLARTLCERALQYRHYAEPMPGRENIAEASLKYVQMCGVPYLKHYHLPDTDMCIICSRCDGASVVEFNLLPERPNSDSKESHIRIHFKDTLPKR